MAYNFKSIADVEVVAEPTESANVLIEENGIVKKAPKTAVGGAGGSEPDLVIAIDNLPTVKITADTYRIEKGSAEDVINAIKEDRMPNVKIRFYVRSSDVIGQYYSLIRTEITPSVELYGEIIYLRYLVGHGSEIFSAILNINFDNSFEMAYLYKQTGLTTVS